MTVAVVVATGAAIGGPAMAPASAAGRAEQAAEQRDVRTRSAQRLHADLDALTAVGAVSAVGANRGATGPVWRGASGVRSIDAAVPARPSDELKVASITKAMISTVAMQQVDRGQWTLRTTVGEVLPGLLPGHESVTLEQLLSHRTGLPDYIIPLVGDPVADPAGFLGALTRRWTDQQLVAAALAQPWLFPPGTSFSYSNANYVVVGMMLAASTHRSVAGLLQQRVFAPAGMTSTRFPTVGPAFDGPHLSDYALFARPVNLDGTSSTFFSSAGAAVSTATDITSFYRALFAGKLVSAASLREMTTPRTTSATGLYYGLGIYLGGDPCPAADGSPQVIYGHDGASFGTQSIVFTSADGTRQASIGWGGRQYTADSQQGVLANTYLIDALTASCPRPVPAPDPSAKGAPNLPPWVDTLLTTDVLR